MSEDYGLQTLKSEVKNHEIRLSNTEGKAETHRREYESQIGMAALYRQELAQLRATIAKLEGPDMDAFPPPGVYC